VRALRLTVAHAPPPNGRNYAAASLVVKVSPRRWRWRVVAIRPPH